MEDVIVAISTALGKGAIGLIRLSGDNVLDVVKNYIFLKNKVDVFKLESHKLYLANVLDNGIFVDEVMVVFMKGNKTYTGSNIIEISCHNNIHILEKIINLSLKFGARIANPGEFTERAFLNGKIDLSQAEAVLDVIHAESNFAEKIAQKQLKGSLTKEINFFRDKLLDILKDLEVYLDHDGILELDKGKLFNNLNDIKTDLNSKIQIGERVNKFFNGIKVALVGRPNVGKSSILNSIIEKNKAIVSDIPGTTRDLVEAIIEHKEIKIEITDTAGLKNDYELNIDLENKHGLHLEIEKKGIEKTKDFLKTVDIICFVLDLSQKINEYDMNILSDLKSHIDNNQKIIIIGNKNDISSLDELINQHINFIKTEFKTNKFIKISAKTRENIKDLLDLFVDNFSEGFDNIESDQNFMVNSRHKIVFDKVIESLNISLNLVEKNEPLEIIASEIRRAIDFLGNILGIGIGEEILNRIFSNFCIGK